MLISDNHISYPSSHPTLYKNYFYQRNSTFLEIATKIFFHLPLKPALLRQVYFMQSSSWRELEQILGKECLDKLLCSPFPPSNWLGQIDTLWLVQAGLTSIVRNVRLGCSAASERHFLMSKRDWLVFCRTHTPLLPYQANPLPLTHFLPPLLFSLPPCPNPPSLSLSLRFFRQLMLLGTWW